ncbi:quinone-dependent dihydroorotate dehydrogenase [soil metagenome]
MSLLWKKLVRPVMFRLDAEKAHDLGMAALRSGLAAKLGLSGEQTVESPKVYGELVRFGLKFENPMGLAAGFDKNGVAVEQLAELGFGFVEVGTVTFEPQPGNPKPRLFRLPAEKALINRLGFNNDGAAAVAERLKKLDRKRCIVGVNIGRNKEVANDQAVENYLNTFDRVSPFADYVAVNVSSPNTPDLRDLQRSVNLDALLRAIRQRNGGRVPLLVKIAPDLSEADIESIVDICLSLGIAGIIATNTTISREGITPADTTRIGAGGLSGKPLERRSTEVVSTIYRHAKGQIPIIGVGGIFDAHDAFNKVAAGASLVQAYTGFVYGGPGFAREINRGLAAILREKGFRSLDEAVGSAVKI